MHVAEPKVRPVHQICSCEECRAKRWLDELALGKEAVEGDCRWDFNTQVLEVYTGYDWHQIPPK